MVSIRRRIPSGALLAAFGLAVILVPGGASAQERDSVTTGDRDSVLNDTHAGEDPGPTAEELASLLPEELPGAYRRGEVESGVQQGEPGARATYEGDAGRIRITLGGIASMRDRLVPMLEMQAAREEVDETTYRDHRAFQGPMQDRRQVFVLVGGRLAVRASTPGEISMDRLRSVLDALDWTRLEKLAGPVSGEEGMRADSTPREDV